MSHALRSSATALRWGARALSVLILLFWGFFLIAHLVGDEGRASRPLAWQDYATLSALIASLAGLALALKWERAGAFATLAAVAVCAAVNWRVLLFPGALIPFAALLDLLAWYARSRSRSRAATV